jgi:uncharacterized damage-inducible protein DinB
MTPIDDDERINFLTSLDAQRRLLCQTVRGLDDDQASRRTTPSELCLAGVVKHVALMEERWVDFIERGPEAIGAFDADAVKAHLDSFRLVEGETLADVLERYEAIARRTEQVVRGLPSLDVAHPLPEAPWFEPGATWSARRVLAHILAESAQHSGHADIIREALDGAKTMG